MQKCNHCQNSFPRDTLFSCIDGEEELFFCCKGCQSVYFLLKDHQAQSFYHKLQETTLSPPTTLKTYAYYDSEEFQRHISTAKDGTKHLNCLIHNIHCSACIWLNELMLSKLEGILEVHINYTNHQAYINYDPSRISPSDFIRRIYELGYSISVGEQMKQKAKEEKQNFLIKLIVAIFCTMNIMWIAIAQYGGYFQGMSQEFSFLLNVASFLLCTPVLFFSGSLFYFPALKGLKAGRIGMDLLVFSGSALTYFYSIYASITGHESYFESVSMILSFVLLGKFLENKARESAGEILQSLSASIPQTLNVNGDSLLPQEVPIGSQIELLVDEKIIIDGILESDFALLDESSLSGESKPVEKRKGDPLYSGSINLSHSIHYTTNKTYEQSTLNTLISLLQKAQYSKPKIQKLANAISSYFSQIILLLAICTFSFYYFALNQSFDQSLKIAVSLVIIACPCALALATPIANIAGLNTAFRSGILFKEGSFLETLSQIRSIGFDKTGTLTQGKPQVVHSLNFAPYDSNLLALFLHQNIHPIAKGILSSLPQACSKKWKLSTFKHHMAQGVSAKYTSDTTEEERKGKKLSVHERKEGYLLGGSLDFLKEQGVDIPSFKKRDGSIFAFAVDGQLVQIFFLQDSLKPEAKSLIAFLASEQISSYILSGDEESEVQRIAKTLSIPKAYAKLSPQAKAQSVERDGAMVGDGINDALALQSASIGISIIDKSDLALQNSDIILLHDNLLRIAQAISIAKKTQRTIKTNILISLCYNAITIPIAMFGYISPIFAALSMSISSILVVLNSLTIQANKNIESQYNNTLTSSQRDFDV